MERKRYVRSERDELGSEPMHSDHDVVEESVVTERPVYASETVTEHRSGYAFYDSVPGRVNTILFALLTALESLLALRFVLVAFGANRTSGFVDFILDVSYPFVRPFNSVFANRTWDEGIIEVNTLLAMGVWLLGFALVAMLVNALMPNPHDDGTTGITRRSVTHS